MSMGYGASCRLVDEDENWLIYKYYSFNLNLDTYEKAKDNFDGIIILSKDIFPHPTIVRKKKKMPNGRKLWIETKKYPDYHFDDFYDQGKIIIENSSYFWAISDRGIDYKAIHLIYYLREEYEEKGKIPNKMYIYF